MQYKDFKDLKLSALGFGTMRLPLNSSDPTDIDQDQFEKMVDLAIENGVNYFDTAWPYHNGYSELALGKAIKKYDRSKIYIADKYPGHQIASVYQPAKIFEKQLEKLEVDYIDFYLLHNVTELSYPAYDDPKWGIIDYFIEQKKLGRIKHLGFSSHGKLPLLTQFLDKYGQHMEFCQIQYNYLDAILQQADEKNELLKKYGIATWVMEPLRGGKLAVLNEENTALLKGLRPDESIASWGFRWLNEKDNVVMILSGMSNLAQMEDNLNTFNNPKPLNETEKEALNKVAQSMLNLVPCTGCRYCCQGCPMQLDIPSLLNTYNDLTYATSANAAMYVEALDEDKKPSNCIECGQCTSICPQSIDIPKYLQLLSEKVAGIKSWKEVSKEREEAAKKLEQQGK